MAVEQMQAGREGEGSAHDAGGLAGVCRGCRLLRGTEGVLRQSSTPSREGRAVRLVLAGQGALCSLLASQGKSSVGGGLVYWTGLLFRGMFLPPFQNACCSRPALAVNEAQMHFIWLVG